MRFNYESMGLLRSNTTRYAVKSDLGFPSYNYELKNYDVTNYDVIKSN